MARVAPLVTDPDLLFPLLHNFGRFEAIEPVGGGSGEYDVFLDIGTIHVGGRVEVSHPAPNVLFWHATRGTTHTLELRVDDHPRGSVLTMTLTLSLLGLGTGWVAERLARPIMARHVVAGLEQLRHAVEFDLLA